MTNQEIEEMFRGIPEFVRVFQSYEREISHFKCYSWEKGVTKEKLERKKQVLLRIAQELNHSDLLLLYYIKRTGIISGSSLIDKLRKLYAQQCECRNLLYDTDEYADPVNIGWMAYGKKKNGDSSLCSE